MDLVNAGYGANGQQKVYQSFSQSQMISNETFALGHPFYIILLASAVWFLVKACDGHKQLRQDWEQGKPVDVGLLLDTIDRLTDALAESTKKLDEAVRKIEQLTKSIKLEQR